MKLRNIKILLGALSICGLFFPSHTFAQIDSDFSAGGGIKIGPSTTTCDGTSEGAIRYNSTTKFIQLCDGAAWTNLNSECDATPTSLTFADISNATASAVVTSTIEQVTDITCTTAISISGGGTPEYRTCSDSSCTTEIQTWTSSNGTISNSEYMQLRNTASSGSLEFRTATVNVGTIVDNFTVTTQDLGTSKRVFMSRSPRPGGAYGGLAGADAECQADADAQGFGGTFYAWLSTDSTDDPESRFTRATVPYVEVNGGTVANNWTDLTDGSIGHAITNEANGSSSFSCGVWTNTNTDGTARNNTDNCNGWTSNGSSLSARHGAYNSTGSAWTASNNNTCDNAYCLLCFEQ